jgi:hypothetical protein
MVADVCWAKASDDLLRAATLLKMMIKEFASSSCLQ